MNESTNPAISLKDLPKQDRGGYFYQRYVKEGAGTPYNALRIEVNGRHKRRRVLHGIRSYFVISGVGSFEIEGEVTTVSPDMLFTIFPGQSYSYKGKMKLFEFNVATEGHKIDHEDLE